jgi:hypothetical protein
MPVYQLFPDINERKILTSSTKGTAPPGVGSATTPVPAPTGVGSAPTGVGSAPTGVGSATTPGYATTPGSATTKVTLKAAFTELFNVIKLTSSPNATLQEIITKLKKPDFETLKKVGYFIPATTVLAVETSVKLATILSVGAAAAAAGVTAAAGGVIYEGVAYVAKEGLFPLIKSAWKFLKEMPLKRSFGKLYDAIQKAILSKTPGDKYEKAFNNLKTEIQAALIGIGYGATTDAFKALVDSMSGAIEEKKRCDEKEFLDALKSGTDRYNLKLKLEGLLKKLDLNSEDEFLKFQKKVVETLTNQFSLFSKFQQKVLDELYKIGIPQIKEVEPDFFQILNDDNTEVSEHKVNLREMRNIYKYDMADLDQVNI